MQRTAEGRWRRSTGSRWAIRNDPSAIRGIPGVAHTLSVAGQSFLLNANGSNFGSCFVILKPFEERHGARELRRRRSPRSCASASPREIADAAGHRLPRAADPRASAAPAGSSSRSSSAATSISTNCRARPTTWSPPANADPRLRRRLHHVPRRHAADLSRHRPHQVRIARACAMQDVFNTLQVYMGGYLRQPVQQVRPHLAGQPAGRASSSATQRRRDRQPEGPQQARARWCRWPRSSTVEERRRAGHGHALQHVRLGAGQRQPRARASARARSIDDHGRAGRQKQGAGLRVDRDHLPADSQAGNAAIYRLRASARCWSS